MNTPTLSPLGLLAPAALPQAPPAELLVSPVVHPDRRVKFRVQAPWPPT